MPFEDRGARKKRTVSFNTYLSGNIERPKISSFNKVRTNSLPDSKLLENEMKMGPSHTTFLEFYGFAIYLVSFFVFGNLLISNWRDLFILGYRA